MVYKPLTKWDPHSNSHEDPECKWQRWNWVEVTAQKKRLDAGEFMTPQATSILHGKPRNPLGVAPWQHPKHVAMGRPCSSYWFPSRDSLLLSWVSRLNYTAQASPLACFTSLIQESLGKLAFKEPRVHSRRNSENWFTITKSSVHQLHEPNSGTWQLKRHRPSHSFFFAFPRAHWLVIH